MPITNNSPLFRGLFSGEKKKYASLINRPMIQISNDLYIDEITNGNPQVIINKATRIIYEKDYHDV